MRLRAYNLYNGSKIFETATTIWLYRNNPEHCAMTLTLVSLIPTELTLHAAGMPGIRPSPSPVTGC